MKITLHVLQKQSKKYGEQIFLEETNITTS